ncbi:MAG: ABC transporter permease [Candidatus Moduliflexus flocculans]|nr:ABC transporter permease [Candidatus Moduliflexus flocculans]
MIGFERVQVNPSGALRDDAIKIFDRTFAITTAMQLVTTLVAFIGVLSSLLALQLEKAREMGILRALGLDPCRNAPPHVLGDGSARRFGGTARPAHRLHPRVDPDLHH